MDWLFNVAHLLLDYFYCVRGADVFNYNVYWRCTGLGFNYEMKKPETIMRASTRCYLSYSVRGALLFVLIELHLTWCLS